MSQFVFLSSFTKNNLLHSEDVELVVQHLKRGGLCILPSESGYMLSARAVDATAVEGVFRAKTRPLDKVMHVACSSLAMAETVGVIDLFALRLLGAFTPGPLTVVVKKTELLPDRLVTLEGSVGIRIPDSPVTLQVIGELGGPVTATSLNESGKEPLDLNSESLRALAWQEGEIVFVVAQEVSGPAMAPSTLVRTLKGKIEVLRAGPIDELAIQRVSTRIGALEASSWT